MLVAALLHVPLTAAQRLQPATFVSVSASVVRVEADRAQGGLSLGSGVTVAPSVVVTNCHVIRDAQTIRISGGGNLWAVTGQHADATHDLCFLHVPAWHGPPAGLRAGDSLRVGQDVAAIGFTGGTGRSARFGRVRALHSLDGAHVIESDTAFTSGASGGGLFDASGALVGLLTFRLRGSSGNYYSVPVRWIRDRIPDEDQWADIHPLSGAQPFWQREREDLPYFMRAAPLSAEGRWGELIELAERWSAADPRDAAPLRFRGEAMQRLNIPHAAVGAYAQAIALAPDAPSAWYGLALAYASVGNVADSLRAQSRLADLDSELGDSLREAIARIADSP